MQLFDVEIQEGARDVCLHNASMTYMSLWYYVTCRGLYTPTAFPSGLRRTEGKQNGYFSAFSPQYFSEDFPELVRSFLAGPISPTDFSDGLPMD